MEKSDIQCGLWFLNTIVLQSDQCHSSLWLGLDSPVGSVTTPLMASSFTVTEGYLGILGVGSVSVKNNIKQYVIVKQYVIALKNFDLICKIWVYLPMFHFLQERVSEVYLKHCIMTMLFNTKSF